MYEKVEMMVYPQLQKNNESHALYYLNIIQFKGECIPCFLRRLLYAGLKGTMT